MSLPTINYPTDRPNFAVVHVTPRVMLAFSYETCIGYMNPDAAGWVLRENTWGPTTGKHLNWLDDDPSKRIPGDQFEDQLQELLLTRLPTGEYA